MPDINTISLSGTLEADPDLHEAEDKKSLCRLYIAVAEAERAEAHVFKVVVFGPRARGWASRLSKGDRIAVVGRLQPRRQRQVEVWEYPLLEQKADPGASLAQAGALSRADAKVAWEYA